MLYELLNYGYSSFSQYLQMTMQMGKQNWENGDFPVDTTAAIVHIIC